MSTREPNRACGLWRRCGTDTEGCVYDLLAPLLLPLCHAAGKQRRRVASSSTLHCWRWSCVWWLCVHALCVETVLYSCHDLCWRHCDSRLHQSISRSHLARGRSRGRGSIQSRCCPPRAAPLCIISHDCRHPHTGDLRPHAASASFRRWASCFASHWHCSHSRLLSPINVGAASSSSSERQRHETAKRCEGRDE